MKARLSLCMVTIALAISVPIRSSAQFVGFPPLDPQPLLPILQVLNGIRASGSIEISGVCDSETFPHFPLVNDKKKEGSTLTILREMLTSDSMQVTQDPSGIVRMIQSDVPRDFLDVRISHITFKDSRQSDIYTANDALWFVLDAPEVVAFMRTHNIEGPSPLQIVSGGLWRLPSDDPHISGALDNVTVEEALDKILLTFPGIWLYEDCRQSDQHQRTIFLRFYHSRNGRVFQ